MGAQFADAPNTIKSYLKLLPLLKDASCDIGCNLQLEDQPLALMIGVDGRVVTKRIPLHIPVNAFFVPIAFHAGEPHEHVAALLQMLDPG